MAFARRPRPRGPCRGARRARARRRPTAGRPAVPRSSTRASVAATRIARRTSGRAKNRSPRTWNGIPAAPSAASIAGSWAFVRTRIAIAPCAVPARASARIALGHPGQLGLVGREAADLRLGSRRRGSRRGVSVAAARRREVARRVPIRPAARTRLASAEDLGRRAVVGLEPDDPRARVALGEADQVVARGAGERVDRLVLVADDRQVLAAAEPRVEERGLERVGVLVFVDREPAVAVADLGRDRGVGLDQPDRQFEHVLEIDPAGARLGGLVAAVEAGHQVGRQRGVAVVGDGPHLVLVRTDPARLRPLDLAGEVADLRGTGSRRAARPPAGRGSAPSIRGSTAGRCRGRAARNGGAGGARRHGTSRPRRPGGRAPPAGARISPAALSVKVTTSTSRGRTTSGGERVGDPSRDDPRLATPRAGQDAQRSGRDPDRLALGRIEVGEEGVGVAVRHSAIVARTASPAVIRWRRRGARLDA